MYPQSAHAFLRGALLLLVWAAACAGRIAITEVLKDPPGSESACPGGACLEFIEITNFGMDTLRTGRLFLTDGEKIDSILPWPTPLPTTTAALSPAQSGLAPGRSAVILDPQYADAPEANRYRFVDGTVLWTVDHVSIVGGLSRDKGVLLYRGTRENVEEPLAAMTDPDVTVSIGERLAHHAPVSMPEGWALIPGGILFPDVPWKVNPDSVDPGYYAPIDQNQLLEYRLGLTPARRTTVPCTVGILGIGPPAQQKAVWRIRRGDGPVIVAEGTVDVPASIAQYVTVEIPKDTVVYHLELQDGPLLVRRALDLSPVWLPPAPVKISEIFPRAADNLPEWVELVNTSAIPIDLCRWRLGTTEASDTISWAQLMLAPGAFLVLTQDRERFIARYPIGIRAVQPPHWQTLDNYHDTIHLWSPLDSLPVESVCYDSRWFTEWGTESLARVALTGSAMGPDGWTPAAVAGPGQPSSTVSWRSTATPSLSIAPIPFTPNGDGHNDLLVVKLQLPASYQARLEVYSFNGDLIYTFPHPLREKLYWNGMTSSRREAPIGPFFVVAVPTDGSKPLRAKGILWR